MGRLVALCFAAGFLLMCPLRHNSDKRVLSPRAGKQILCQKKNRFNNNLIGWGGREKKEVGQDRKD